MEIKFGVQGTDSSFYDEDPVVSENGVIEDFPPDGGAYVQQMGSVGFKSQLECRNADKYISVNFQRQRHHQVDMA